MTDLKLFNIPFVGLKQGNHLFEYEIDNSFFEAFDFDEFHDIGGVSLNGFDSHVVVHTFFHEGSFREVFGVVGYYFGV